MRLLSIALAVALVVGAGYIAQHTAAWQQMLALMGCVLWAGKAILLVKHFGALRAASPVRFLPFVIAWPGMNVRRFLLPRRAPTAPTARQWRGAFTCTAAGVGFLALGALLRTNAPLLASWIGLVGIAYLFFFGLFLLSSLMFRAAGIDAQPLFREPRKSQNLIELWGRRWNRGFHDLVLETVYAPLARRSAAAAAIATFMVSGGLHELVLSIPARGGYGLPMLYFAIQAAGVGLVGSRRGARWGLREGQRAWNFGAILSLGGLVLLFAPAFHRNVVHVLLDDIATLV